MTTVIINEKAICNGNGHHNHNRNRAVLDLLNGHIYVSGVDAAKMKGMHQSAVSNICNRKAKRRNDLIYVDKAHEHIDEIAQVIKNKNKKIADQDREIAELKEQLSKYQYIAEKEKCERELEHLRETYVATQKAFDKAKATLSKEHKSLTELDNRIAELEHFVGRR